MVSESDATSAFISWDEYRDHSYITSALKGGRGVGQMLIFADEGGRGGIR